MVRAPRGPKRGFWEARRTYRRRSQKQHAVVDLVVGTAPIVLAVVALDGAGFLFALLFTPLVLRGIAGYRNALLDRLWDDDKNRRRDAERAAQWGHTLHPDRLRRLDW